MYVLSRDAAKGGKSGTEAGQILSPVAEIDENPKCKFLVCCARLNAMPSSETNVKSPRLDAGALPYGHCSEKHMYDVESDKRWLKAQ